MNRRAIRRAGFPPRIRELQLKIHARSGRVSVLQRLLRIAVAEELRVQATAQGASAPQVLRNDGGRQ